MITTTLEIDKFTQAEPTPPPCAVGNDLTDVNWLDFYNMLVAWMVSCSVHLTVLVGLVLLDAPRDANRPVEIVALPSIHEGDVAFEVLAVGEAEQVAVDGDGMLAIEAPLSDSVLAQAEFVENDVTAVAAASAESTWDQNFGRDLRVANAPGSGGSSSSKGVTQGLGAEFFGLKTWGHSFVFVVDRSASMTGVKFERAKRELLSSVKRLKTTQRFYVVFFDSDTHPMFGPGEPERAPLPATPANIKRLTEWLSQFDTGSSTAPREAMQLAVDQRPDAVYFLTDGELGDDTEAFLKQYNWVDEPIYGRRPKTVIHSVCFMSPAGLETLKRISRNSGGTYRIVQ